MSVQFVAHALSYNLGKGSISLKGKHQRPWLEIVRSEVDRTYLTHQLRTLKHTHDGAVDYLADRVPTDGFYDLERIRFHGDLLWRVYELLYPKDEKYISSDVLKVAGIHGLTALWIDQGKVIGWFNGPMEFGPRALGGRSIIGDPRNQKMQSVMNLKIKYRESFRPFAPSVLVEDVSNQFEINCKSPYMLMVAPVKKELCKQICLLYTSPSPRDS